MALLLTLMAAAGWSSDKAGEQQELQLNRAKWDHRSITSYDIRLRDETCFCPPPSRGPFRVNVKGGKVIKAVYEGQKGNGYWPGRVVSEKDYDMNGLIATVEEIFLRAEKVINAPDQPHKIRYDPEYGFPTLINVDNPPRIADAQWRLVVDEFRPANR